MRFYPLSIKKKAGLYILFPTLLAGILAGWVLYMHSRTIAMAEARARLNEISESYRYKLNAAIQEVEFTGNMMHGLVQASFPSERLPGGQAHMMQYKEQLTRQALGIAQQVQPKTFWVVFNPELAPGAHTVSFREAYEGTYLRSPQYRATDKDLNSPAMQWWTQAIENGAHSSLRYYWHDWNMEIISYSKAVYHDSLFVGVAGSDFAFTELRNEIASETIYETGFLSLIDENYNLLIHPRYKGSQLNKLLLEDEMRQFKHLADSLTSGLFTYRTPAGKQLISYKKLNNQWLLLAHVPYKEVHAGTRRITRVFLLVVAGTFLLALFLANRLGTSLTNPVRELVAALRTAADGNLNTQVKIQGSQEIQELNRHFNQFMLNTQHLINELQASEKEGLAALIKAEEAEQLKSAFLSNMSHELRTPLNVIQGMVEIMTLDNSQASQTDPEYTTHLTTIQEQIDRLIGLINNMMELAQTQMHEITLQHRPLRLTHLLQHIGQSYQNPSGKVTFHLSVDISPEQECVLGNEQRIKRVLDILLDNAFQFTSSGYVKLSCRIHAHEVQFEVMDTGMGIPREKMATLFQQFTHESLPNSRIQEGAGLSLAIAKQIAGHLHGSLSVSSKEGNGSIFYFNIPYHPCEK